MPTVVCGYGGALRKWVVCRILQPLHNECNTLRSTVSCACCQPYTWFMLSVHSKGVIV
jgi:hypothetical protein